MNLVLGIDPGLHGAYALIDYAANPHRIVVEAMPLAGGEVDLAELAVEWRAFAPHLAVVERVASMPKQGVASSFKFGRRVGEIDGILAALGIRSEKVTPQAWKKVILAGTEHDKAATIEWCRRAFPSVQLVPKGCRVPQDGFADALALAEYGWRTFCRD
jgi:Holliday junction resolvasome RuvABC endonuclease subunit